MNASPAFSSASSHRDAANQSPLHLPAGAGCVHVGVEAAKCAAGPAETAKADGSLLSVTFPWPDYAMSPNGRGHRGKRARITAAYRRQCAEIAWGIAQIAMERPLRLARITCYPPSNRWDDDNAKASTKSARDGLADALGVNDRDFRPDYQIGPVVKGGAITAFFQEIPAQAGTGGGDSMIPPGSLSAA